MNASTETVTHAETLPEPVIQVSKLSKVYKDGLIFRKKFTALNQVSLEVGAGQIFGLLGPNGAGKTTFLKILLGIIRKTSGQATLLGSPAGKVAGRTRVGFLPEHLRMPAHLTGFTALEYFGKLQNLPHSIIRDKRDQILESVGLSGRGKDRVTKYSKGMLQRLGLAQALLHDPELLILDEPTDGLDPGARADMRALMKSLRDKGVTVFLNSHLLQEVELVCDQVAILNKGQLRYCGSVDQIGEFVRTKTGVAGISINMEVRGNETATLEALGEPLQGNFEIRRVDALPERVVLSLSFSDQDSVDQAVDRIRQKGISLVRLTPSETTLEDAFLKIVSNEAPISNSL
ncbi:MAG: ABC transporter ATP-binding protein [Pirellulaceae bacterium]|nr:ABC transporter ATP-binding protein [Pirellulaceae bacterium]MDG2103373.1 ABC transporter ATP-binding protein [Pirellulaceae bacterium]